MAFLPLPESLKHAAQSQDVEQFQQCLEDLLAADGGRTGESRRLALPAGLSTKYAEYVVEAMKEGSWLATSSIRSQLRTPKVARVDVDMPALIEPLDEYFAEPSNYRVLWARRWRYLDEPINVKECRVAVCVIIEEIFEGCRTDRSSQADPLRQLGDGQRLV